MKRLVVIILTLLVLGLLGLYIFDQYWIHRYDSLIAREAGIHHIDPDLVWSIVYEETYFSPWKKGRNGEIGLMQVTPVVAREWAAESMATVDWRTYPQVVQALTTAAKEDPAATVRAGCVRGLAKMKANTAPVVTVVRDLRKDTDPRVRQEAEQALSILATGAK